MYVSGWDGVRVQLGYVDLVFVNFHLKFSMFCYTLLFPTHVNYESFVLNLLYISFKGNSTFMSRL